jgi:hypothetical protein
MFRIPEPYTDKLTGTYFDNSIDKLSGTIHSLDKYTDKLIGMEVGMTDNLIHMLIGMSGKQVHMQFDTIDNLHLRTHNVIDNTTGM